MSADQDREFFQAALPFWESLDEEGQDLLLQGSRTLRVQAGGLVYHAGDKCLGVILLRSGRLRVYLLGAEGKEITLYFIGLNEASMLASSCILNSSALPVTVEAEEDSVLTIIPPTVYTCLIHKNSEAESYMTRTLMESFSHTLRAVETVVFLSIEQRMALLILQEEAFEQSNKVRLTQEKMSRQLGTAREVVSRQLKRFATDGLIRTFRGGGEILDRAGLEALVPEYF